MNNLIKRLTAALFAAVLSGSCLFSLIPVSAEEEASTVCKINFNCWSDDISFTKKTDPTAFESFTTDKNFFSVPEGTLVREGYNFQGWTYDGIYGYIGNESFGIPEGVTELTMEPVWTTSGDKDLHSLVYALDEDVERPENLKDTVAVKNSFVSIYQYAILTDEKTTRLWTDGTNIFNGISDHFIMPDHDVTLYPVWVKIINFIYKAGDVDRLNGATEFITQRNEGSSSDLAAADRFSRTGFNLAGWHCEYDGKDYVPLEMFYNIPGEDVVFTAIWEPKNYTVVFRQSTKNSENIKVPGVTDSTIICPEATITKPGYHLAGWQDDKGDIYAPGDEYLIYGNLPGLGISLSAVWEEGEPSSDTTTATTTTTTTTVVTGEGEIHHGDANLDGKVTVADAVAILQHVALPDKYALTGAALENADVFDNGDGVTAKDALIIQQVDAGIYKADELPVSYLQK